MGALADWFAVVALFRHPLGIPIPHTAIIPSRKDRIGENLARFIAEHFLHPDVVRARLASVNLAGTAAKWLKSPSGEAKAIDLATRLARSALDALGEDEVRRFLGRIAGRQLAEIDPARLMGRGLAILVEDGRHEELLTQALRFALVSLHDNRARIRGQVRQGSPWWLPGFADDRIVVEMLDQLVVRGGEHFRGLATAVDDAGYHPFATQAAARTFPLVGSVLCKELDLVAHLQISVVVKPPGRPATRPERENSGLPAGSRVSPRTVN